MRRVATVVLTVMLSVGIVPVVTASVAGAVPVAPTLSAPADGVHVTSNPVLSWNPLTSATGYKVQVSASPAFTPLLVNKDTVNTKYGPEADLPLGTLYWRVQAKDGGGFGPFSEVRTFTRDAPTGPTLSTPADGATLDFPTDPPVFSWEPFVGAKRYEIEIDSDPGFVAPLVLNPTSTTNTSYALTTPPSVDQTFYWRVRAFNAGNLPTEYSETRSYGFDWPTVPVLLYPPDDNNPVNGIEEVVFQWTPTPGAVSYELQVSPNDLFTTLTHTVTAAKGTRYSPPTTIDNGAYYWRVRGRNTAAAVGGWSEVSTFYRAWPAPDSPPNQRVTLLSPANDDVSVTLPEFRWTPVRLASHYSFEIGTDPNFSPGSFSVCTTQHTSFIPVSACDADPGQDYYWRVRPIDAPGNILGLYSPTFRFQYDPGIPALLSPADGATGLVAPLELRWAPVPGIGHYRVTILKAGGGTAETVATYATGYVPQNLVPSDGPFTWYVQTVAALGDGIIPGAGGRRTFSFTAPTAFGALPDPITPDGVTGTHVPNLEWQPVAGTNVVYEIWRATAPSTTYTLFKGGLKVSAYTETGSATSPGSFTWLVKAMSGATALGEGSPGSFTIQSLGQATLTAPDHCAAVSVCSVENSTPTFEWSWDPEATHYRIYLAADPNFTNILTGYNGVVAHYPRYRPIVSLPDAQAGQATYWYARPCYGLPEKCGAEPGSFAGANPPIGAFRKRSEPVELTSPAQQTTAADALPEHANQITFDWVDYLASNLAAAQPNDLEARTYKVQISTTADMQTLIHQSPLVDQTTYTMFSATLPDGPLYWRVQAIDQSNNALSFSETRLVHKKSPTVTLTTPLEGASVTSAPVFTWASEGYAKTYTIEVYKNPGAALATANRVLNVTTPMTGWVPLTALPAGDYGWRIQRRDVDDRPGPWSALDHLGLRHFTVAGNQVDLLTPAAGTNFADNNQSFTWTAVAGAAQYRFQSSTTADFATTKESVLTVMTSWHSTVAYANGTYFWRVLTIDGGNNVTATSSTRSFTHGPPPPPSVYYHALTPERILDTRPAPYTVGPYITPFSAAARNVEVAGVSAGVPADADAVTLNVTVTGTSSAGYLKMWPKGQPETSASSLNWSAGTTIANAVTATVGADESLTVKQVGGSANVIIDVVGYYDDDISTGGGFTSLTPKRILDSRPSPYTVGPYSTKWGQGTVRDVQVAGGTTGVPSAADAVVLNVTATGPTSASYLTVWPEGETQPTASSLNFKAGQTLPNAVTAKVGAGGIVNVFNNTGSVNVIVDVVGYFDQGSGAAFRPLANPIRIQDSRPATKIGPHSTPWGAGITRDIQVTGPLANVPSSAVAALLNVTAVNTTGSSYLTVYPLGDPKPIASSLNWVAGQVIPNSVTAKIGTGGKIRAFNQAATTDVVMDISGYYGN